MIVFIAADVVPVMGLISNRRVSAVGLKARQDGQ